MNNDQLLKAEPLGRHLILELEEVQEEFLNNLDFIEKVLLEAAGRAGAKVLGQISRHFQPQGVTVIVGVSESHLSIHTWPEYGYAAMDIFFCGHDVKLELARQYILDQLKPGKIREQIINRGLS
ncbi:MAG: adenosylmethionine decarboxylase [Candidatus Komeilibacteria bacterium CG10_big_fil_rev_8_21_14_0_10_41_13]|uniref:S-adenosylmethionine decarboxylase proenzyme n=1 Tax=Candidatus Komeilibacteria bacterium CG10_big_fil_rev_8_21_14_0_10_41_13 TaxID=1974476 RepID=A0A2M6WBS2_9BACT|nr:MAG: adenosylmethionine decarboxylase [Candidatus Komeilibacteria bacterium CG10_big_fil_rev_8_21_14_0_10_41_13]